MQTLFNLKKYEKPEPIRIQVITLFPHWTECGVCGDDLLLSNGYSLAMYEGKVVNPDVTKEWAGFPVCEKCYRENENLMYLDAFGDPYK